jgi:UPF0716 family protein affecting phage T7 exclusion
MIKNILYLIATILLIVSGFYIYDWYKSEPANKEPLPGLISSIATIILTIIAWRFDRDKTQTNKTIVVKSKRVNITNKDKGNETSIDDSEDVRIKNE